MEQGRGKKEQHSRQSWPQCPSPEKDGMRPKFLSESNVHLPREASDLIFKIRSCTVRTDLKNEAFSADFVLIFKIRSYTARSDLENKITRFSGYWKILSVRTLADLFYSFSVLPGFYVCPPSWPKQEIWVSSTPPPRLVGCVNFLKKKRGQGGKAFSAPPPPPVVPPQASRPAGQSPTTSRTGHIYIPPIPEKKIRVIHDYSRKAHFGVLKGGAAV